MFWCVCDEYKIRRELGDTSWRGRLGFNGFFGKALNSVGRCGPARGGPATQSLLAMAEMAGAVWLLGVIAPHSALAMRPVRLTHPLVLTRLRTRNMRRTRSGELAVSSRPLNDVSSPTV